MPDLLYGIWNPPCLRPLPNTSLADLPVRRGKVRDIYDLGDTLLLVSTDRISAFDWVLPTGIPDKGRVLTQLSRFWFERLQGRAEPPDFVRRGRFRSAGGRRPRAARGPVDAGAQDERRADRVRGARVSLRLGLEGVSAERRGVRHRAADRAARRATSCRADLHAGHEGRARPARREHLVRRNVSRGSAAIWPKQLSQRSLELYTRGAEYAAERGIIIADTKFEFGLVDDELILIDEVLTPDSSRFWPADKYQPGRGQPSFDKQFVRDWLTAERLGQEQPAAGAAGRGGRPRRGRSISRRLSS